MNKEADNIGKIFKETLQNHRMETNADLWARLDTQIASQPHIATAKTSLLKSLSLAKVAASATLIVSVALAYNYIYLPIFSTETKPNTENQIIVQNNHIADTNTQTIVDITPESKEATSNDRSILNADKNIANNNSTTDFKPQISENTNKLSNQGFVDNNLNNQTANKPIENKTENNLPAKQTDSVKTPKTIAENYQNNLQETKLTEAVNKTVEELDLQIPNIFTPNGDGVNDFFVIRNIDKYPSNQLIITNRTGKLVYEKFNYQNNWDAANASEGVYYFVLKIKTNGNDIVKTGMITIAR